MATKGHELAMAFIYMNPVFLKEFIDEITAEELADYMEMSFAVPGVGLSRETLIEQMKKGRTERDYSGDENYVELWNAAIKIIKARGEYM